MTLPGASFCGDVSMVCQIYHPVSPRTYQWITSPLAQLPVSSLPLSPGSPGPWHSAQVGSSES